MAKRDNSDLTGRQFTRLLVTRKAPKKSNKVAYECKCSCGNIVVVLAQSLRSKSTQSCGCLHREISSKELSGISFGDWRVIRETSRRSSNGYKYWMCKCRCGVEKEVSGESLLLGRSKSCNTGDCHWNKKKICLNGHNLEEWGQTKSKACKACIKDKHLRTHYGISLEEFIKIYNYQDGKCYICKRQLGSYYPKKPGYGKASRIEVDHDHKKAKRESVRGLLCGGRWAGCNRKLGRIDNITWLKSVIKYLEDLPGQKVINGQQ